MSLDFCNKQVHDRGGASWGLTLGVLLLLWSYFGLLDPYLDTFGVEVRLKSYFGLLDSLQGTSADEIASAQQTPNRRLKANRYIN